MRGLFRLFMAAVAVVSLLSACPGAQPATPSSSSPARELLDEGGPPRASAPAKTATAGSSPVPDDGTAGAEKCHGRATPELVTALLARGAQAKICYDLALANDRALQGKMRVLARVAEGGALGPTRVIASTMPAPVNDCVLQVLKTSIYPSPSNGCVDVTIPISFVPPDAGAPSLTPP